MSQIVCPQCSGSGAMGPVADPVLKDSSGNSVYPKQAAQPCSQCKGAGYYQGSGN